MTIRRSADVSLDVETSQVGPFGQKHKRVTDATLTLIGCPPDRTKRIVAVETADGWVYRFQRFGTDEPLVAYDRTRPDGETYTGHNRTPQAVLDYVEAVESSEILPEFQPMLDAQRQVSPTPGTEHDVDVDATTAVATDGGEDRDDRQRCRRCGEIWPQNRMEPGRICPRCDERRRQEEAQVERSVRTSPADPQGSGDRT